MGFKKFFEKLTGMESPPEITGEDVDKAFEKVESKEVKQEGELQGEKATTETEEQAKKALEFEKRKKELKEPLSEDEVEKTLKPLEEAEHGTKEDKDFAA